MNRLGNAMNIRPGEGRLVALMLIFSAAIGIAINYYFTASSAIFLAEFDIEQMPYVYILSGFALIVTNWAYSKAQERVRATNLLIGSLAAVALGIVAIRLGLAFVDADWLVFSLFIWFRVMIIVLIVGFWTLANRLFTLTQGKRLFSLISAGDVISIMIGSFLVPLIVSAIGTANLYWIVAGAVLVCLVVAVIVRRDFMDLLQQSEVYNLDDLVSESDESATASRNFFGNRFFTLLLGMYVFAWTLNYLMDFSYFDRLQHEFESNPDEIASFIGVMFGLIQLTNFALKFFISGRLVTRFGLRFGLLMYPSAFLLGIAASTVAGVAVGTGALFFALVIVTKFNEEVLRESFNEPSTRILYQPLPASVRGPVLAWVEGRGAPSAAIISGTLLAIFSLTGTYSILNTVALMTVGAVGWVVIVVFTYRAYLDALNNALNQQVLRGDANIPNDPTTVGILRSRLKSQNAGEVIYALDLLEAMEIEIAQTTLTDLFSHPNPLVRREAVARVERLRPSGIDAATVRILAENDDDASVRAAALWALCAFGSADDIAEVVVPQLSSDDRTLQRGALVGILRESEGGVLNAAETHLNKLVQSQQIAERRFAADVLADVHHPRFVTYLTALIDDDDLKVQRQALLAIGKSHNTQLWGVAIDALNSTDTATAASSALFYADRKIYSEIEPLFKDTRRQNRPRLLRLTRILGRRGDSGAIRILLMNFNHPDRHVRHQIYLALSAAHYQATDEFAPRVREALAEGNADGALALAALRDLGEGDAFATLREALRRELAGICERHFLLLGFLYDSRRIVDVHENLKLASPEKRAYALETLDILLDRATKQLVMPLIDDRADSDRLSALEAAHPQETLSPEARLVQLALAQPIYFNRWICAAALWALANIDAKTHYDKIVPLADDERRLIRETALYTLSKLKPDVPILDITKTETAENVGLAIQGRPEMLLTIEKVLILKTVGIFKDIPDHILAEVALLVKEETIAQGETLFSEGDPGTSMYIIVDGKLRVQTDRTVIAERGDREFIGEMALFDDAPRSATVVATAETHVLRLDQGAFNELMANHTDMAMGIIRVLTERLRQNMDAKGVSPMMADILDKLD